jgi:hypothetical protein
MNESATDTIKLKAKLEAESLIGLNTHDAA